MTRVSYHRLIDADHCLGSKQVSNLDCREIQCFTSVSSMAGESPPLPPKTFFGREELIEKIVQLAQDLKTIALIGPGGIGKTSIILTALHEDRIKQRFGNNQWFIRCDQFSATHTHLLRRLSKVIGAGIENPEDLAPLRQYLSSKEMMIVFDNAESILDPQGTNAPEIFAVVDELTRFNNICICITSRISTIPPCCKTLEVPILSIEAAHDAFYEIYGHGKRTDGIDDILGQLDFHPLSITLLATAAQYNKWDTRRLTREWERQRTGVLHAQHSGSLAATIELSLTSPMFRDLGPDARGLLGVIAFLPQGVNEENIDWLFPTISEGPHMFDTFCILSLTYRSNGFVTMLAPLRDYLRPKDPASSPLLGTTKECYFSRLPVFLHPANPGFEESRWIVSEDVNVKHLVDVFTSIDANSENVWRACAGLMEHLGRHKLRLVVLGPKVEALPDDHPSKALCLEKLSRLFDSVGNRTEQKRLLTHSLKLWRERGNDSEVAHILAHLSSTNMVMGFHTEGIQQAKEASEIFGRLGMTVNQAASLITLSLSLLFDGQLDAAEEAVTRAIDPLPEKGQEFCVCYGHRTLGNIYRFKGNVEKATHHLEVALEIASSFNWHEQLLRIHCSLANLFSEEGRLDDAHAHLERAKSHGVNNPYNLAGASFLQAILWEKQGMLEEAKSEALHALELLEKLGAADGVEDTRRLLKKVEGSARGRSDKPNDDSKLVGTAQLTACIDFPCPDKVVGSE